MRYSCAREGRGRRRGRGRDDGKWRVSAGIRYGQHQNRFGAAAERWHPIPCSIGECERPYPPCLGRAHSVSSKRSPSVTLPLRPTHRTHPDGVNQHTCARNLLCSSGSVSHLTCVRGDHAPEANIINKPGWWWWWWWWWWTLVPLHLQRHCPSHQLGRNIFASC